MSKYPTNRVAFNATGRNPSPSPSSPSAASSPLSSSVTLSGTQTGVATGNGSGTPPPHPRFHHNATPPSTSPSDNSTYAKLQRHRSTNGVNGTSFSPSSTSASASPSSSMSPPSTNASLVSMARQRSSSLSGLSEGGSSEKCGGGGGDGSTLNRRFSTLVGTRWALVAIVMFSVFLVAYYFIATSPSMMHDEWNSMHNMMKRNKEGFIYGNRNHMFGNNIYPQQDSSSKTAKRDKNNNNNIGGVLDAAYIESWKRRPPDEHVIGSYVEQLQLLGSNQMSSHKQSGRSPRSMDPNGELHKDEKKDDTTKQGVAAVNDDKSGANVALDTSSAVGVQCANTQQGEIFIADSKGNICYRHTIDADTHCCGRNDVLSIYSCSTCDKEIECCELYENCVSCCLGQFMIDMDNDQISDLQEDILQYNEADRLPDDLMKRLLVNLSNSATSPVSSRDRGASTEQHPSPSSSVDELLRFDTCMHLCRTSSRSIHHGNSYKHRYKYCYNEKHQNPPLSINEHAVIVTAPVGVSCSEACETLALREGTLQNQTQTETAATSASASIDVLSQHVSHRHSIDSLSQEFLCWELFFPLINTCTYMQQYFHCDGGCIRGTGSDQPAMVDDTIQRSEEKQAGLCLVNSDTSLFHCDGRHPHTRRLCPCVPIELALRYT